MSSNPPKLDRNAFSVVDLTDINSDREYWKDKSPSERLLAAALIREIVYGREATTGRLQRFFEVVERKQG